MTPAGRWRRQLAVVVACLVAVLGLGVTGAGTAAAQVAPEPVTLSTDGASATCTIEADLTLIDCELADTKPDHSPVFLQWAIDDDETRWDNKNGFAPTNPKRRVEGGLNNDQNATSISWRVCVDKNLRGDTCSRSEVVKGINRPLEFVCPPPSPSIPPDLQNPPNCYPVEPDPRFSELDKCAAGIGIAIVGLADEAVSSTNKAREIAQQGGRVVLRKLGPVGWGLTITGAVTAIAECNP